MFNVFRTNIRFLLYSGKPADSCRLRESLNVKPVNLISLLTTSYNYTVSLIDLYSSSPTTFWITVIGSFLLTWILGLLPTLLLKIFVTKSPMKLWKAVILQIPLWIINLIMFTALGSESQTHTALGMVSVISIFILTGKLKLPELQITRKQEDPYSTDRQNTKSKNTLPGDQHNWIRRLSTSAKLALVGTLMLGVVNYYLINKGFHTDLSILIPRLLGNIAALFAIAGILGLVVGFIVSLILRIIGKTARFSSLFFISLFLVSAFITIGGLYDQGLFELQQASQCSFEIVDLEENRSGGDQIKIGRLKQEIVELESSNNRFKETSISFRERDVWEEENYRWFHYEGIIRNRSSEQQHLININAKLRTEDNIFIKEGWSERIETWLAPGEGIPFKVTIKVDSEDLVKDYILNENESLKTDFYPWFDTCSY